MMLARYFGEKLDFVLLESILGAYKHTYKRDNLFRFQGILKSFILIEKYYTQQKLRSCMSL
jgi:hypothetical protein